MTFPVRSSDAEGTPSALSIFVKDRLAARDEDWPWLFLTLALGGVAAVAFLITSFGQPETVQDDGRMFLSWMSRWDDPTLLRGDLVADFWYSVSPWFFRAVYHAAWAIGIEPLVFTKILPALLYPLIALFSYRFVRAIGGEPLVAFVTVGFVLHILVREDIVISGTPRALWPVLLLATLDGLARRSAIQTAIAQLLMTGTYPQLAIVDASIIGLTLLSPWRRPFLDLRRDRLLLVALSAAATIGGIIPFFLASGGFGPTVTFADALRIPTFSTGGRGQIQSADGSIDFICGPRLGIFNGRCDSPFEVKALLTTIATVVGPLVLFARLFRNSNGKMRSELPFYLLATSLAWFVLAALVLFRLHLPNRYTAGLAILGTLTTIPIVVEWIRDRPFPDWLIERRYGRIVMLGGTAAVLMLAVFDTAGVKSTFRTPKNPQLMAAIRALPKDAVVGGFVRDLDFSPIFTERSTLFSRELAIAYQLGYFRPISMRMENVRDIVLTRDPAELAARLRSLKIDRLLARPEDLAAGKLPRDFRGFFGADLNAMEKQGEATGKPPLVAELAGRCTSGTFDDVVMLDAACLIRQAEQPD